MSDRDLPTVDLEDSGGVTRQQRTPLLTWVFPERVAGEQVAGNAVALEHGTTLGRADTCSVVVDCEGVSRQHVEFSREGPALIVADAGSTNGTFLDGERVAHGRVRDGSVLRVGSWVGIVEWASRRSGAPPAPFSQLGPRLWGGEVLRQALEPARQAAPSRLPVLLVGETGTGKEVSARALHEWSSRPGAFIAVNCAALPRELAEAELFGYRRGAFSGATRDSLGYFRSAHRGTLLLDEINELPMAIQAKLLRVLQEQSVTPLGQAEPLPIDVRTVCASQAPLARAVAAREFRADLYMRLNGLQIELPPLRKRRVDIPRLFLRFLDAAAGPTPSVHPRLIEALCLYDWPGNIRELELVAQRLLAVQRDEPLLELEHLPPQLLERLPKPAAQAPLGESPTGNGAQPDRAQRDRDRLAEQLLHNGGNLSRACAELGISRQRAYRLLAGKSVREFLAESSQRLGE